MKLEMTAGDRNGLPIYIISGRYMAEVLSLVGDDGQTHFVIQETRRSISPTVEGKLFHLIEGADAYAYGLARDEARKYAKKAGTNFENKVPIVDGRLPWGGELPRESENN
jgi:hypothetical protein